MKFDHSASHSFSSPALESKLNSLKENSVQTRTHRAASPAPSVGSPPRTPAPVNSARCPGRSEARCSAGPRCPRPALHSKQFVTRASSKVRFSVCRKLLVESTPPLLSWPSAAPHSPTSFPAGGGPVQPRGSGVLSGVPRPLRAFVELLNSTNEMPGRELRPAAQLLTALRPSSPRSPEYACSTQSMLLLCKPLGTRFCNEND